MIKNNRMMMAEAIQVSFKVANATQRNGLKDIITYIDESRLIDCLLINIHLIPIKSPVLFSSLASKLTNSIASEVLYSMFVKDLQPWSVKSFDALLMKSNIHINKRIKTNNHTTRNNLIPIIMKIDQNIVSSSHSYRKLFGAKHKKFLCDMTKKKVKVIRPLLHAILEAYNKEAKCYEHILTQSRKFKPALSIIRTQFKTHLINYMSKTPHTIMDIKCGLPTKTITQMTQSINTVLNMQFTFDEEYNKMIMAIIDEPIFRELLAGSSTDTAAVDAKVGQARVDVIDGLGHWDNLGRGNVFFQYVVDFRGRISQIGGLSAVGHKVGKSMVKSGHAHMLGEHGYNNILIALAGAVGYDKETFAVRLAWAKENLKEYETIGRCLLSDPVAGFSSLRGCDDPFAAAVISLELVRIAEHVGDVSTYCSNIFIGYDATSSAVQLVGLLMGNAKLTEASNVRVGVDTEDKIHDSYMLLADIMDVAAPKLRDDDNKESIDMWLAFEPKIKRAFAKPLLMTRLYGSKFLTHMDSVRAMAIEKGIIDSSDTLQLRAFGKHIATLFNTAFDNEEGFNCLRSYENFTKAISAAYNKKGIDTVWSVHDNTALEPQRVVSTYRKFTGEPYKAYFDGKTHTMRTYHLDVLGECETELTYHEDRELHKRKAVSSIAPNYIHSHDAIVLHSTVMKLNKPMRLTHDCFATTPGMVHEMQECIDKTYVELFGDNNLKQIEALQEECFENTGILVDLPDNYNSAGISSEELSKAIYKFS